MTSVVSQTLPIELMGAGEHGNVVDVYGPSDLIVRLEELGLHEGTRIRMIRPGSPCIIEINHQRFSLRFDDSVSVLVSIHLSIHQ